MKITLFLFFSLLASTAFAQQDTAVSYTDLKLNPVGKNFADYVYKLYKNEKKSWTFSKSTKYNEVLMEETYADSMLTDKTGPYYEYKNRKVILQGMHVKNQKEGDFITYDSLGKMVFIVKFHQDLKHGITTEFKDDVKYGEQLYDRGQLLERTIFYRNGNVAIKESFKNGRPLKTITLDSLGQKTSMDKIMAYPMFKGGMIRYFNLINRYLEYPLDALAGKVTGFVKVGFTVSATGKVEEIKIIRKLSPSTNDEAIRLVQLLDEWQPALFLGKPYAYGQQVDIIFDRKF